MTVLEFKEKLDNKEFRRDNSSDIWNAAFNWQQEVNNDDFPVQWSWDCGLRLDYDGNICRISSRFYPPHKNSAESEFGKYNGAISVVFGDEILHKKHINAETLDELQAITESCVREIFNKIYNAVKATL